MEVDANVKKNLQFENCAKFTTLLGNDRSTLLPPPAHSALQGVGRTLAWAMAMASLALSRPFSCSPHDAVRYGRLVLWRLLSIYLPLSLCLSLYVAPQLSLSGFVLFP